MDSTYIISTFWQLIEYYDENDGASLTSANAEETLWNIRSFTEFDWMNVTHDEESDSLMFSTSHPQPAPFENNTSGSIDFQVKNARCLS